VRDTDKAGCDHFVSASQSDIRSPVLNHVERRVSAGNDGDESLPPRRDVKIEELWLLNSLFLLRPLMLRLPMDTLLGQSCRCSCPSS
jgi:hypothetical protein